jgi:hypothetical protein
MALPPALAIQKSSTQAFTTQQVNRKKSLPHCIHSKCRAALRQMCYSLSCFRVSCSMLAGMLAQLVLHNTSCAGAQQLLLESSL